MYVSHVCVDVHVSLNRKKRVKQNFQEVIHGSAVGEAFTARTYIMEKAMSDNIPDIKLLQVFFDLNF